MQKDSPNPSLKSSKELHDSVKTTVALAMVNFQYCNKSKEDLEKYLNGDDETFVLDDYNAYHVFPFGEFHESVPLKHKTGICRIAQLRRLLFYDAPE